MESAKITLTLDASVIEALYKAIKDSYMQTPNCTAGLSRVEKALQAASDTKALRIGSGIVGEAGSLFAAQFPGRTAVIVADATTFRVAGSRVQQALQAAGISQLPPFVFTDPGLYARYDYVDRLTDFLKGNDAIPVAVGSGTINDLTKLSSHLAGRRYMTVATAASMDGYTAFGASITKDGAKQTFSCPAPQAVLADIDIIRHALQAVGITDKASQYTAELSDGERQKVMIAKALVQECPLILLDEPTAFLDVVSRIEIMTLLHRLAEEEQKAILLSTHDIEQALVLADRLWLLTPENGMECGVTEDLILNNRMDTLFARQNSRIRFDLTHGVFSPTVGGKKSIRLNAANEVLEHWTQNALNRRNYFCLPDETAYAALPLLTVVSPQRIELTVEGQTTVFRSFDQLLQTL